MTNSENTLETLVKVKNEAFRLIWMRSAIDSLLSAGRLLSGSDGFVNVNSPSPRNRYFYTSLKFGFERGPVRMRSQE